MLYVWYEFFVVLIIVCLVFFWSWWVFGWFWFCIFFLSARRKAARCVRIFFGVKYFINDVFLLFGLWFVFKLFVFFIMSWLWLRLWLSFIFLLLCVICICVCWRCLSMALRTGSYIGYLVFLYVWWCFNNLCDVKYWG